MHKRKDPWMLDSCKLLWHMDRVLEWEKGNAIAPILIDIGMTKVCQLACTYCYGAYQELDNKSMIPGDVLVDLFREAPCCGVKAITITGDGENTIHPRFVDSLRMGKKFGVDMGLATNGVSLGELKVRVMCQTLTWCRVNISAGTRAGYIRIHGRDYFEGVVENIVALLKEKERTQSKMTLGLQMVLVPECLEEVIPLAQLAVDLGVDYLVIKQFSDPGSVVKAGGYDHGTFVKVAHPVLVRAEKMSTEKTRIIPKWQLIGLANKRVYPRCIDLPFLFQVSGTGKCYPCGYLFGKEEYCYGDLKKQGFADIISSDRYWGIIDMIAKTPVEEVCQGCCRHDATNAWLTGYMDKPEHINFI